MVGCLCVHAEEAADPFTDSLPYLFDIHPKEPKLKEVIVAPEINTPADEAQKHFLHLKHQSYSHKVKQEKSLMKLVKRLQNNDAIKDPCLQSLVNNTSNTAPGCQDRYMGNKLGPKMLFVSKSAGDIPLLMTKYYITQREYSLYCLYSGNCKGVKKILIKNSGLTKKDNNIPEVGIDLSDVEHSIQEYNEYCIHTGKCPGVFAEKKDIVSLDLTAKQAEEYAAWLSQVTGYHYRLPTEQEWLMVFNNTALGACDYSIDKKSLPKELKQKKLNMQTSEGIVFSPYDIGEFVVKNKLDNQYKILGPLNLTQKDSNCDLQEQSVELSELLRPQTGFHLVRELSL